MMTGLLHFVRNDNGIFLFVIPLKNGIHCAAGNPSVKPTDTGGHCVAMDTGLRRYDDKKTPERAFY